MSTFRIAVVLVLIALVGLPLEQFNLVAGRANLTEAALIAALAFAFFSRRGRIFRPARSLVPNYLIILICALTAFALVELLVLVLSPAMDAYAPQFFQQATLRLSGIGVLCVLALAAFSEREVRWIAIATIVAAAFASLTLLADASGLMQFDASRRADTRIGSLTPFGVSTTGIMSTKGSIAMILAAGLVAIIYLRASERPPHIMIVVSCVGLLVLGALASGSRTPVTGLLAVGLLFLLARLLVRPSYAAAGWAAVSLTLISMFYSNWMEVVWREYFLREGRETRLQLFEAAWRTVREHPLFGVGPHYQPFQSFVGEQVFWNGAHTIWLQLPLYAGVTGWLLAAVLLASVPVGLVHFRRTGSALLFVSAGVTLAISSFYQPMQSAFVAWSLLFGVMILFSRHIQPLGKRAPRRSLGDAAGAAWNR